MDDVDDDVLRQAVIVPVALLRELDRVDERAVRREARSSAEPQAAIAQVGSWLLAALGEVRLVDADPCGIIARMT